MCCTGDCSANKVASDLALAKNNFTRDDWVGMDKTELLVVLNSYPTLSETFLYTTLENLQSAGFTITICARKRGESPHQPNFKVHYLPREDWWWPRRLLVFFRELIGHFLRSPSAAIRDISSLTQDLRAERRTWRQVWFSLYRILPLLRQTGGIVYFAHGGLATTYLSYIKRRPSTLSLRGSDINIEPLLSEDYKTRLAQTIRAARSVHCVCRALQEKAENLVGEALPQAHVIYTAVNPLFLATEHILPATSSDRQIKIISVGRLDWRKGFEHGLMAMRELCVRGIDFYWQVIGEGPYRIALEWAMRDLGLEDRVSLIGGRDQVSIRDALAEADVYFHPAVHEGLSNAVLEAMAVGLPVVVSDVGGMREAITDGMHGYLVPPRDWRAMADALEKLSLDATARAEMGTRGAEHVRAAFSLEHQRDGFAGFFHQALI